MKIAIQFYGHLRTFERCMPTVKHFLLDLYDCDVFMHTWSETEHRTKSWHDFKMKRIRPVDDALVNELKKKYNIKSILVEQQQQPDETYEIHCLHGNGTNRMSAAGVNFMLYSQAKVNDLRVAYQKEHGITYDYVLVLRPDIMFYRDFNFKVLHRELTVAKNKVTRFCPVNATLPMNEFALGLDSASDVLFTSSPEIIDQSVNLLRELDFRKYEGEIWNPENLFNRVLLDNGIISTALLFLRGRDWNIIRETSPVTPVEAKVLGRPFPADNHPANSASGVPVGLARDAMNLSAIRRRYLRYKFLSRITWGDKRKHYKKKAWELKERIRPARRFRKHCR